MENVQEKTSCVFCRVGMSRKISRGQDCPRGTFLGVNVWVEMFVRELSGGGVCPEKCLRTSRRKSPDPYAGLQFSVLSGYEICQHG